MSVCHCPNSDDGMYGSEGKPIPFIMEGHTVDTVITGLVAAEPSPTPYGSP